MQYMLFLGAAAILLPLANSKDSDNPFFQEWDTPFAVPPFDRIKLEHYQPAFDEGMKLHRREIAAIVNQRSAPTFQNTVEAMDRSGQMLSRVANVFFSMKSSMTSDAMEGIARDVAPRLSQHQDEILLDSLLFQKVERVYQERDRLGLAPEPRRLLEQYYKDFVRGGAKLPSQQKERLKAINAELSLLSLKFGDNVLKEDNRFELVLGEKADLVGLPENVIAAAADAAAERGHKGQWAFTLHKPSMIPFLQYSPRRDLREKIYTAYLQPRQPRRRVGQQGDGVPHDRAAHGAGQTARLRDPRGVRPRREHGQDAGERAQAAGPTVAAGPGASREGKRPKCRRMIDEEGGRFKLQSWDWWYYAERVKKANYDLDEEMLRPYFNWRTCSTALSAWRRAVRIAVRQAFRHPQVPRRRRGV